MMDDNFKKFFSRVFLFTAPVPVLFAILYLLGYFPIITDNTVFDQKMVLLARQPARQVKLMAIGSSVTLFQVKSKSIVQNFSLPYYNFAAWSLQITDFRKLADLWVNEYHPRYVIMGSSIPDFQKPPDSTLSVYLKANSSARNDFPGLFYLDNFNPLSVIVRRKLLNVTTHFDRWGGEPAGFSADTLWIKYWKKYDDPFPTPSTEANYRALDTLSTMLMRKNIKFVFMQFPIAPEYSETAFVKQNLNNHFARCRRIVEKNEGIYLNFYNTSVFPDSLFHDRYHTGEAGDIILTKEVVADLKKIIH